MFKVRASSTFSTITNLCPSQAVTYTVTQMNRKLGEATSGGGGNDPRKPGSFDHAKDALKKEPRKRNKQARRKKHRETSRGKSSRVCQDGGLPTAFIHVEYVKISHLLSLHLQIFHEIVGFQIKLPDHDKWTNNRLNMAEEGLEIMRINRLRPYLSASKNLRQFAFPIVMRGIIVISSCGGRHRQTEERIPLAPLSPNDPRRSGEGRSDGNILCEGIGRYIQAILHHSRYVISAKILVKI